MTNFLCIVGTRPEAVKMAPVILQLQRESWANVKVVATAQHREILDQIFRLFNITPDIDLNLMQENQTLPNLTARLLTALDKIFEDEAVNGVIAQGDTTTVFVAALACFYRNIPFYHVEAGLRSHNFRNPFPEEMNRIVSDRLSTLHFAPTETAKQNLLAEGISEQSIYVTGNTVIDALQQIAQQKIPHNLDLDPSKRLILVTAHRRENFGEPFLNICQAIRTLVDRVEDIQVLYPVHPNPNVKKIAYEKLGNHPRITLCDPLDYGPLAAVLQQAYLILTDSGGIQEEAPTFGKPVLVLRTTTERPEGVTAGVAKLVGTDTANIVQETLHLLNNKEAYLNMAKKTSPYGDGLATNRIIEILKNYSQK